MLNLNVKYGALLAPFCFVSFLSIAGPDDSLVLNYDGFFDRMEKLDEPEFVNVKLAFYLKQSESGEACPIKDVSLTTKLTSKSVYFYESGEILIPYDKQMDLDKAKLLIEKSTLAPCHMDMRLESTQLFTTTIKPEGIKELSATFDGALKELSGMMSFLMPDVSGVTFLADQELTVVNSGLAKCKDNRCTITINKLEGSDTVMFNVAPTKAIPFIPK